MTVRSLISISYEIVIKHEWITWFLIIICSDFYFNSNNMFDNIGKEENKYIATNFRELQKFVIETRDMSLNI